MTLAQFEHALRASKGNCGAGEFYVVGTAAILPQHPELGTDDQGIIQTQEVDVWPVSGDHAANELEAIGESSAFHDIHGFYIDPYNPGNAILPGGWMDRTVTYSSPNTAGAVAHCVEKHDLAVAKLARGARKDLQFVRALLDRKLLNPDEIEARINAVDPNHPHYQHTGESPIFDLRNRIRENLATAKDLSPLQSTPISPGE